MHHFHFDAESSRLFQRLTGFLTRTEAESVCAEVAGACAGLRPGALTMLADLRDYPPQSQEVSRIGEEIAALIAAASPAGFAVVTGSALQRLRLRRVMAAAHPRFFETVAAAATDLGWEAEWVQRVSAPDVPPRAAHRTPAGR